MSQPPKTATKQSSLQTSTKSKPEVVKKQEEIPKQQAPKKSELRLPNNAAAPKSMKRQASQPAENFKRAPSQQAQNPSNTSREHSPKQSLMKTAQITVCHEENSKRTITEKKKIESKINTGIKKKPGVLNVRKTEFLHAGSKTTTPQVPSNRNINVPTTASKQKIGGLAKSRQISRNQSPVSSDGQQKDGQNFKRGFNKLDNHASKQSHGPQISVNARDGKINRFDTQKTELIEYLQDDYRQVGQRRTQNDDVANPMDEDLLDSGGNENNENDQSQENEGSNHQDDNHENISIDGDIHDYDDDNDEQLIDDYIQDDNPGPNNQEQEIHQQNSEKKCDAYNFKEQNQENQRNQEELISLNIPKITIQKEDEENVEFVIPNKEMAVQNKNLDNEAVLIREPQEEEIKNEKEIINTEETEVVQNTTQNEQIIEIQNCEIPQNSIDEMNEVNIKNEEITKNDSFEKEVQGKQQNKDECDDIQLKQIKESQQNIDEITNTHEDHNEMKQSQVEQKEIQEITEPKPQSEILINNEDDQNPQIIQLAEVEPQIKILSQQEEVIDDELQHSSEIIATTEENHGKKEQEIENLANSSSEQILKDENPILQESPLQDENNEIQQETEIMELNQNVGSNPNLLEQDIFEPDQVFINQKQDSDDSHELVQDQNDQKPQIDFSNQNSQPLSPVEVKQGFEIAIENDNEKNIEQILKDEKIQSENLQENHEEILRKQEICENQGELHEQINELQPNSYDSKIQETNLVEEEQQYEENKNFCDKEDLSSQNQPILEENPLNNQNSVLIEQYQLLSENIQQINEQGKEEPHSIQKEQYKEDTQVQQSISQDNQENTNTQIDQVQENNNIETKGLIQVQQSDGINQVNETNPPIHDIQINKQQLENFEEPNNSLTDQIENSPLEQKDENEFAIQQQDHITEKQSIEQLIQISAQNQMDEEDLFDQHEQNSPLKDHLAMEQQYTESDIDRRLQTIQEEEDGQRLRTENYDSLSDNNSNEDDVVRIEPEQVKSNTTESNPQETINTRLRNDEIPIENQEIQTVQEQIRFELQEANLFKDQMFQKKKVDNTLENLPQCLYEMTSEQKVQQQIEEIQLKDDFITDSQLKIKQNQLNTDLQEGINQNTNQQKLQENNKNFDENEQSKNQLDNQNDDQNQEQNNDINQKQTLNQEDEDVQLQKSRVSNKTRISHEIGDEQPENDIEINTQQIYKAVSYDQENDENDFPQQVQDAKNTERESLNLEIPGVFRSDEFQNNQQQFSRKSSSNDELQSGNFYQQPSVPIHKIKNIPKLNLPFTCTANKIENQSDRLDTGRTVESIMNQITQQQWLHPLESVSESVSITSEQQQKPPNFVNNQQFFNQMKKKNIQIDVLSDIEESATPEHQPRSANPTPKPLDSQKHTKNTMSFGIQQDQLNQQKKVPISPNSQHQLINDDKAELQRIQQKREQDFKKKQKDSLKHKKKIEELEQKEKEKQFLQEKKRKEEFNKQRILQLERMLLKQEKELQEKNYEIQEQNILIYQYQKQIDSLPKLEQNENFQQVVELIDDHQRKMCELISNLKEDNFIVNKLKQKYQLLFQQQQIEFKQQLQLFSVYCQTDHIQLDLEQCLSIVPIQSIIEELFEKIKILRNQSHTTSYFIGQTSKENYSQMNQLSKRNEFKDRINELNETLKFEVDHLKQLIESENRELTANQIYEILNSDIEMQNKVHQTLLNLNNIFKERLHQIKDGDDHMFKMLLQMSRK